MPISEGEDGPGRVQNLMPFKPGSDAGIKRLNYATHTAPDNAVHIAATSAIFGSIVDTLSSRQHDPALRSPWETRHA